MIHVSKDNFATNKRKFAASVFYFAATLEATFILMATRSDVAVYNLVSGRVMQPCHYSKCYRISIMIDAE